MVVPQPRAHKAKTVGTFFLIFGVLTGIVLPGVVAQPDSGGPPERKEFIVGVVDHRGYGPGDGFHGGTVLSVNEPIRFLIVETSEAANFGARARNDPNVRYVEENLYVQFIQQRGGDDVGTLATPTDPQYGQQKGPQQVRAPIAWDTSFGSTSAAVCVIDSGVRYTHEDIAGTRWLGGHDYVNADTDPNDDNGHGSHVAGIAAATVNNGVGVAGMAQVGIYGVKTQDSTGGGTWGNLASGITWCADNTMARTVISMSLGGAGGSQAVSDAVNYAYNTKGKLLVAANGNGGPCSNCILFPAAYDNVVAVTSLQNNDQECTASSDGPQAEISAPGHDILSTWHTSNTAYFVETGCWTSMATPHVSGAAALTWSQQTTLTNVQLRQRLRDASVDLGAAGWDEIYGYGRLDTKNLLDGAKGGVQIFAEKFDSTHGFTLSGLWRQASCQSFSTSLSLAYNQGTCPPNFNTGATTSGDAISPSISIPSGHTNIQLNWQSWHQTESGTTFDQKTVSISTDNGATWTQLQQEDGTQQVWNTRTANLNSYAGMTVKVRFRFDSVDSAINDGQGWYVDSVEVVGTPPQASFPYSQNFDSGTAPGWTLSGLWHVTNCQSFSSPNSLGYNQGSCPPNFNVGTTSGDAISPGIPIPAGTNPVTLSWKSWHQTESGITFDKKTVSISSDNGVTWTQLQEEDGTQTTWNARSVDITSYAGSTIKIRFRFDSVDSAFNDGQGWYVDNVDVSGSASGGFPFSENLDDGAANGFTLTGLWRVTNCQSFSTPNSLGYNQGTCPPNFNVGTTTGNAVSPAIAIPAGTNPVKFDWQSWHQTESGTTFDKKLVEITNNDGASWTLLWQEDGTQTAWNARSVDITSYAGSTIKVRFRFDSIDGAINDGQGWYVDNIQVYKPAAVLPGAPTNPGATPGPGAGQITVTWSAPTSNGGCAITSYKLYRSTSSGGPFSQIASVSGSTFSYVDSGLGNGVTRWYRISAVNCVGEGPQTGSVGATTFTTPGAPQNPSAVPGPIGTLGRIDVSWSAPSSNGGTAVTGYNVYRNDGGGYFLRASVGGTSFSDTGLQLLKGYRYRIAAVNLVGEGPWSSEVCSKPSPWAGNLNSIVCV